jgi:biotin carboxyl carrier protein
MTARSPIGIRLVVSPCGGRLRLLPPERFVDGVEIVEPGQPVALLTLGSREVVVRAPVGGRVTGVLGLDGEPVGVGQPLLVIQPEDS